jgi:hypothetical protein
MTWLMLLIACGDPSKDAAATDTDVTDTDGTDTDTTTDGTDTDVTDTDVTDTDLTEDEVLERIEEIDSVLVEPVTAASDFVITFTGMVAVCDGNTVTLSAEAIGAPESGIATPWLGGVEGTPISLDFPPVDSVFRMGNAEAMLTSCEQATWVWEVEGQGNVHCKVTGPDAVDVAAANPGCLVH